MGGEVKDMCVGVRVRVECGGERSISYSTTQGSNSGIL